MIDSSKDGAMDHMHVMAKKYTGRDRYTSSRPGETRIMYTIEPERVIVFGSYQSER